MDEELRRIATENVSNRRKAGIIAMITGLIVLIMFIMVLSSEFQNMNWIAGTILVFVVGFKMAFSFEKKVIGQKTAVDLELERLKALYPEEKLVLPKIDEDELKLREMVRRSNREDKL